MPRNYALGSVAITALSLLLTRLGTTGAGVAGLVGDRVGDTVVGVVTGVLVAVLVRNRHAGRALDDALAAVQRSSPGTDARTLRGDLLRLREARARLLDDDGRLPRPARRAGRGGGVGGTAGWGTCWARAADRGTDRRDHP